MWTSLSGSQLEALFVQSEGDKVLLQKPDGSRVAIRLLQLSAADQEYVRGQAMPPAPTDAATASPDVGDWKPGEASAEITCRADPEWSYVLYLPKAFDLGRKWPVLYIMMPTGGHADQLNRYIQGAELCGWCLAISVQSQNGFDKSEEAVLAMVDDVQERLPIDVRRRYGSGDSGGARMTFWLAGGLKKPPFAGIIPVIAGSTSSSDKLARDTTIYGLDGCNDYNRYDMANAYWLNRNGLSRLRYVPGGHGGDFGDTTTDAMIWLNSCYLLNVSADPDRRLATERLAFIERVRGEIERMKASNPERAYEWALALTQSDKPTPDLQTAKTLLQSLLTIPRVSLYVAGLVDLDKFVKKHLAQTIAHSVYDYSTPAEQRDAEGLAEKYKDTSLAEIFSGLGKPTVGE